MSPTEIAYYICKCYLEDLDDVDTALVSKLDGFRRARDVAALTSCSSLFDRAKHTINDWKALRQIEAFFKKNSNFTSSECSKQALHTFVECEAKCSRTNMLLKELVGKEHLLNAPFRAELMSMVRYIDTVLGDPAVFLAELPHLVRVTPGATAHSKRANSIPQLKMRLKPFCTRRASKYVKAVYHFYGFPSIRTKYCKSNRVELVPKNWKTDRTIACEPEGNLPLQLAFDTYAKRRLRRYGIDLRDQSANQRRAKHASIHNDFVTVDFKSASDTLAYNTVALLFKADWFAFLSDVRAPFYRGVFGEGMYSKFSSMGNGTTFSLETLVFAAACYACGSRNFLVYGDDVIIEKEFYESYIALTSFLGFQINVEKSFADGPFRESCGADYFSGIDVTPKYLRGVGKRKADLCHLVNTFKCISRYGGKLSAFLDSLVKDHKLPLVPYNENSMSGIWIDPDIARAKKILCTRNGISTFKSYVAKHKQLNFWDIRGYYLWFLSKNKNVSFSGPWGTPNVQVTRTSSVAVYDHVYVRRRVCWFPSKGMPDYLY